MEEGMNQTMNQTMYSHSWAEEFLAAHERFTKKGDGLTVELFFGDNSPAVRASNLEGDIRKLWYDTRYPPDPTPLDYRLTQEQGRIMEVLVIGALREMGYTVMSQQAVKGNGYTGTVDGYISGRELPQEDTWLLEVKHLGTLNYLDIFYNPLPDAAPQYFWQAQAYQRAAGAAGTLFVVVSQDASSVRAELNRRRVSIKPNPKVFAFLLERMEGGEVVDERALAMAEALQEDSPPSRERDPLRDWICRPSFCGHRARCLRDGDGGKVIFRLPQVEVNKIWLAG